MTATIVVSVTVPTEAISGTVGSVVITATSQLDSNVFDKVTNVITVGRVYHNVYLPLVIKND